ncbi:hypothetical protein ABVK25_004249 [Lepraria finkii]|uniref:Cell wall mannoprotein PIR1-like C-terminal domain-containing protein n=1 Tax=Lepraria finkii TaxID=1340010 RepID=A0ABR4BF21_9LECA
MKYTVALLALAAAVSAQTPPGCSTSFSGSFEIAPVNITGSSKRDLAMYKRQTGACTSTPIITLENGKLTDQEGRTGEIVSNAQFQFDNPTQSGTLFTSGFSICSNGTLAIGGSAIFYSCLSGTFDNLYSESQGGQCFPIYIDTIPCTNPSGSASVAPSASETTVMESSTVSSAGTTLMTSAPVVTSAPVSLAPMTMTMAAPFPVSNSTTPAGPTASSPTISATPSAPATFTPGSGANMLAVGSKLVAGVAGLAGLAMF